MRYAHRTPGQPRRLASYTLTTMATNTLKKLAESRGASASSIVEDLILREAQAALTVERSVVATSAA